MNHLVITAIFMGLWLVTFMARWLVYLWREPMADGMIRWEEERPEPCAAWMQELYKVPTRRDIDV